jgi:hypothetical protein
MNISEGYKRLAAIGHTPTWKPPSDRHVAKMRELKAQHEQRIRERHQQTDKRIEDQQQHQRELLVEVAENRRLLRLNSIDRILEDDRATLTWRQDHRSFLEALGSGLGARERQQLEDELSGVVDDSDNPLVRRLAAWLRETWTREQIDVVDQRDPRITNGSAHRKTRFVAIAPIINIRLCLIAAHEVGHIVHPELDDYREVLAEDKFHKLSVPAECASWRWVLDNVPYWSEAMHSDMQRFLNSYRSYATDDEKAEMDRLCSALTLKQTLVRIAKEH